MSADFLRMPKAKRSHAGSRYVLKKDEEPKLEGKWYPADDVPKPRARKFTPGTAKLRKSLTPGTVVILVAGRFKGKRAVFLKQLPSGLLLISGASWLKKNVAALLNGAPALRKCCRPSGPMLALLSCCRPRLPICISGPYAINGVPLKRVNQAFVIATSTKVDVSGLKLPASVDDKFFKPTKAAKKAEFGGEDKSAYVKGTTSDAKKSVQAEVDASIKGLDATLKAYLKDRFALSNGDKPHEMKF